MCSYSLATAFQFVLHMQCLMLQGIIYDCINSVQIHVCEVCMKPDTCYLCFKCCCIYVMCSTKQETRYIIQSRYDVYRPSELFYRQHIEQYSFQLEMGTTSCLVQGSYTPANPLVGSLAPVSVPAKQYCSLSTMIQDDLQTP